MDKNDINKYTHFQFARRVWIITSKVFRLGWHERVWFYHLMFFYLLRAKKKRKKESWWIAGRIFSTQMFPFGLFIRYRQTISPIGSPISFICSIFCIKSLSDKAKRDRYLMRKHISKASKWMKGCCHKSIYIFAEVLFALIVIYFFLHPSFLQKLIYVWCHIKRIYLGG